MPRLCNDPASSELRPQTSVPITASCHMTLANGDFSLPSFLVHFLSGNLLQGRLIPSPCIYLFRHLFISGRAPGYLFHHSGNHLTLSLFILLFKLSQFGHWKLFWVNSWVLWHGPSFLFLFVLILSRFLAPQDTQGSSWMSPAWPSNQRSKDFEPSFFPTFFTVTLISSKWGMP